jgi:glycosyltransferase involved in cell wall biosynthesis
MGSLGIVVPAFRPDVGRIESYLRELCSELDPDALRVELDDPDAATLAAISELDLGPLAVNAVPYRRGKGAAVTAGFEALSTDRLAFADADGSTPAAELSRVVDALGSADVAAGSRRHPDATVVGHRTLVRRLLGDGFAWLARHALDAELYDYQCGAKALTADAWERVRPHIYEPGFAWDLELLAVAGALGLRVREVPIRWEDRPGSTVAPIRTTLSMAKALLATRHRAERLKNSTLHGAIQRGEGPTALIDRTR